MSSGASIFSRPGRKKLYAKVRDVHGVWQQLSTDFVIGQEAEALAWAEGLARQADRERAALDTRGPLTVRGYSEAWLVERARLGLDAKNDGQRLRDHVLPVIGDLPLASVRARDLAALIADLRRTSMSPKTIRNVYSVVQALFRDAEISGAIDRAPAKLTRHQLPPVPERDPTEAAASIYPLAELEALIGDWRVPLDRQVVYGLAGVAGLRHGEIAALLVRHVDLTREPLGCITVARSNAKAKTKTGAVRLVPILPALADALGEWLARGWAAAFGRPPTPDDLLVPLELDEPGKQARANPRAGGMRSAKDTETRRERDQLALGIGTERTTHDLRATFVTLAEDAGIDPSVVAKLTHTAKARGAYQRYSRTQWETLCRELARLQVQRRRLVAVPARAVGDAEIFGDALVTLDPGPRKDQEPLGVDLVARGGADGTRTRSNSHATPRDGERLPRLAVVGAAPNDADRQPVSPNLGDARSPSTTCDLVLAAMRAAKP